MYKKFYSVCELEISLWYWVALQSAVANWLSDRKEVNSIEQKTLFYNTFCTQHSVLFMSKNFLCGTEFQWRAQSLTDC